MSLTFMQILTNQNMHGYLHNLDLKIVKGMVREPKTFYFKMTAKTKLVACSCL